MGQLIKYEHFNVWNSLLDIDIQKEFDTLSKIELHPKSFTFYTSVSVISSSKIEGEPMDVDSYVKHKMLNIEYLPELTKKPDDLYEAYLFARDNPLTRENFQNAHRLLTAHLLPQKQRGELRNGEMLVLDNKTGRIQYEAAPLQRLKDQYEIFWEKINDCLEQSSTIETTFFNAAFIHLVFVNIHPFSDGNGRLARLLEKWFLAEKLGEKAWFVQSEKFYYKNVEKYFMNLTRIGSFYDDLNYEKAIPFLLMLPQSLVFEK